MTMKLRSDCLAKGIIPELLASLGRTGLQIRDLYVSGKHREITMQSVDPCDFTDPTDFMLAYSAVNLLKKYPCLDTGIDKAQVAMEKFLSSEEECRAVNEHFARRSTLTFRTRSILEQARSEVKRILRGFSWDSTLPFLSHGPGATFGTKRERGHPWYKFGEVKPTVTGEALALTRAFNEARPLIAELWGTNGVDPLVCVGSKIATVPKDSRSDRVIAIEPLWNMFFQKGIGGLMRSRLKQTGCDLNDQRINQELALKASMSESLATLDLSSASDTISRSLVDFLLPEDWLVALKACRSTRSLLPDGRVIFLQKFSSMGNGYTFELESLIFLSVCRVCSKLSGGSGRDISVYGDDIIAPSQSVDLIRSTFEEIGFKLNSEKSFSSGPFRESCGKHYFRGHDVTPFYLKKKVVGVEEQFWLLNSVRRLSHRLTGGRACDRRLYGAYHQILATIDRRYHAYSVPDGYGDGGILRDFDEVCPTPRRNMFWVEGWTTRHLVRKYKEVSASDWPALIWRLSELERRSSPCMDSGVNPLGVPLPRRFRLRAAKLSVLQWPSLGPWVDWSHLDPLPT